jgi:hypothetical protein
MKVCARRFNLYLAAALLLAVFCGCQTQANKKDKDKVAVLRVHLQASEHEAGGITTVSIMKDDPVSVTIEQTPVLTEAKVIAAKVIDTPGGFAIEIHFDESGALMLEQYSAANPGRHFVIFGQWGQKAASGRWLAAPLITHRNSSGELSFTPDITRAEADKLVLGLNNLAAKAHQGMFKQ